MVRNRQYKSQDKVSPGGGETICPPADGSSSVAKIAADLRPSADGSAVRTSLAAGGGKAAGSQRAYSLSSCAMGQTDGRIGSRVVGVLDSGAEGPGFKSQSRCCQVTVLGKLFTPIVLLFTKQRNW